MKTASRLTDLISKKKKQIALAARFFVFLNAVLCDLNVKRPRYALFLWRSCRMCMLTQYFFFSCLHVRFYFSLPLIFTLLAASISHFLTAALNSHVFLPTKNVSFVFNNSL